MRLLKYFNTMVVESILLILYVELFVKSLIEGWFNISPYIEAGIAFFILYLLGSVYRLGRNVDLMNEYIIDDIVRHNLGLNSYRKKDQPILKTTLSIIVKYVFLLLATGIITLGLFL